MLQSSLSTRDYSLIDQVNKLVREIQAARHVSIKVQTWVLPLINFASSASVTRHWLIDQAAAPQVASWRSNKLARVARSSLAAEAQALSELEQEAMYARLTWSELLGGTGDPDRPVASAAKVNATLVIDSKAMYDVLEKGEIASSAYSLKDKYTALELQSISQHLTEQGTNLQWCDSDHQAADRMTKSQKQDSVRKLVMTGTWRPEYHIWHSRTKRFHKELSESLALLNAARIFMAEPWHALDLCCGKSLTSALLSLEEIPPEAITAVDLRSLEELPHHGQALQRAELQMYQETGSSKDYKVFLKKCLGGSPDEIEERDQKLLGIESEIFAIPEAEKEESGRSSDSEEDTKEKNNETVCFAMDDSDDDGDDDDDESEDWDLEDAYNFDPERVAELLQRGNVTEEELVEAQRHYHYDVRPAYSLYLPKNNISDTIRKYKYKFRCNQEVPVQVPLQ
eukprot:s1070_g15.t1